MISFNKLFNKVSEEELSVVVGKNTIQRMKNGENMRLSTLEKICKHFKVQIDDIVEFK